MENDFQITRTHLPLAQLYRHAAEQGDHPAFVQGDRTITYGQLLGLTKMAASRLAAAGVGPSDRVVVVAGNDLFFPALAYAVSYLGAIAVPCNYRLAAPEIAFILGDCSPKVVVSDAERKEAVAKACTGKAVAHLLLDELADGSQAEGQPVAPALRTLEDDQAIMYTSGTTGNPKGAVLTYANFMAATTRVGRTWNLKPDANILIATPLFHIAAFDVMLAGVACGATSVIQPSVAFDADVILDAMAEHGITHTFMVPAQWQLLVDGQRRQPRGLQLRFYGWGAAPATQTLLSSLRETFPDASSEAAFGQTETTAIGVSMGHEDSLRKLGSVGTADLNFSIRVVDADMQDVARGEVGEIVYRGPGVMSRYWNNEAGTAAAFRGGWFHSGDLVRQDEDGFIYVVDRLKDMIISGGENIYSAELENVIAAHPKVADVAVVAREDAQWGQVPVAVIAPRDADDAPTLEDIRAFCEDKLARYKLPKAVAVVAQFPRTGTGKVQKNLLRAQLADGACAQTEVARP